MTLNRVNNCRVSLWSLDCLNAQEICYAAVSPHFSVHTAFTVYHSMAAFLCTQHLLYTTVLLHFSVHSIYCTPQYCIAAFLCTQHLLYSTPQYCCISLYTAFTVLYTTVWLHFSGHGCASASAGNVERCRICFLKFKQVAISAGKNN